MKRAIVCVVSVGVVIAGCGSSEAQPDGTQTDPDVSVLPATDSQAPESTAPDNSPVPIDQTLRRGDDTSVAMLSAPVDDPSPADGDAIPGRPQADCAFAFDHADFGRVDVVGCEFESVEAASAYVAQWNTAIALSSPKWGGESVSTAPIDAAPDWVGRVMLAAPGDYYQDVRADLVQQRGARVYTVSAFNSDGEQDATVAGAVAAAEAQQAFLDEHGIDADTPLSESDPSGFLSIRYLAPTWAELAALGPDMTGPADEYFSADEPDDDGAPTSERYWRVLTAAEAGEWGDREMLTASVSRYATIENAQQSVLRETGLNCIQAATPVEGSPDTVACQTSWNFVITARHGNYTLSLDIPQGLDPAAAQQLFIQWNQRFVDLGLPAADPAPPLTAAPRTDNPLPTDSFAPGGFDGSYYRTGVGSAVDDDGGYSSAYAEYRKTADTVGVAYGDNQYEISIKPGDSEVEPSYSENQLVGTIGAVTADAWTTVVWQSDREQDSADVSMFDAAMVRLLPSGDRIEVRDRDMFVVPAVDQPNPPFAIDGPLLTSVWDNFQSFSLAEFTADPDDTVEARWAADSLIGWIRFEYGGEIYASDAEVAPDSPAGTVAEWRILTKSFSPSGGAQLAEVERQLIAFNDEAAATAFVTATTNGAALTPIEGVDGTSGGFDTEAGLIVFQRGKWVLRFSSPGRQSWGIGYESFENPILIDRFAQYAAEYFASSRLS